MDLHLSAARSVASAGRRAGQRERDESGPSLAEALEALPRWVLFGELAIAALLGGLHALLTWAPSGTYHVLLVRAFDVDREMNVPTWFASTEWLLLALTLAAIAVLHAWNGSARWRTVVWVLGALAATYFSADEVAVLHERLGTVLEELARAGEAGSPVRSVLDFRSYYWPLAYAPFAIPAAVGIVVVVWRELGPARRWALLGLFVFLYAAVGLDLIEGRYGNAEHTGVPIEVFSRIYLFDIFLLEETLEMLGLALVSYAFLCHVVALARTFRGSSRTDGHCQGG